MPKINRNFSDTHPTAEHLTTAHKTATPRPRLEGDPTPLATPRRRDHPSLPRWLAVPDPCRSGGHPRPSLLRWLAVPDPCRSGGHPRPSLPPGVAKPAAWVAEIFLGLVALFGCCDEKLIWVGVGYFLWKVIIKK